MPTAQLPIPVIDVFAGPGGLGEGFAAHQSKNERDFRIVLSVEMDEIAHRTLELRAFFRQFPRLADVPKGYYNFLKNPNRTEADRKALLDSLEGRSASSEAWQATLGRVPLELVRQRVEHALADTKGPWVLIGGPPCQAYSMVGRARNKGKENYKLDHDEKHGLYKHYLQIIADYQPDVFVMENVKGLLSARTEAEPVFRRLLSDLEHPRAAIERYKGDNRSHRRDSKYVIRSIVLNPPEGEARKPREFVVNAERYGIPQARHRVILLGVREDHDTTDHALLLPTTPVNIEAVINDLPRLRSSLSRGKDSDGAWRAVLKASRKEAWFRELAAESPDVADQLDAFLKVISLPRFRSGNEFLATTKQVAHYREWYQPDHDRLQGVCNHTCRSHMASDLHRYLFATSFAACRERSPQLADFPSSLLPKHGNVSKAMGGRNFADRFRVQRRGRPSTTITSHMSKDGHYYIHYDATQCRSLSIREAARIQTFPDNYLFCGNATQQYHQVGNAVPPLLASQIASIVASLLRQGSYGSHKQVTSQ